MHDEKSPKMQTSVSESEYMPPRVGVTPERLRNQRANATEGAIGSGLRSLYQDVVHEPLPDDFLALLDSLSDDEASEQ